MHRYGHVQLVSYFAFSLVPMPSCSLYHMHINVTKVSTLSTSLAANTSPPPGHKNTSTLELIVNTSATDYTITFVLFLTSSSSLYLPSAINCVFHVYL